MILVVSIIMGTFMIFYVAPGLVNITWVTGLRNKQINSSSYGIVSNEEKGLHSLLQQDYINEKIGGKVTELNSRPCTPGLSRWYPHHETGRKMKDLLCLYSF